MSTAHSQEEPPAQVNSSDLQPSRVVTNLAESPCYSYGEWPAPLERQRWVPGVGERCKACHLRVCVGIWC
ncbi:hypothetical protein JTE90_011500 [Oedothorax gibbosus]|uniref:Uncharacterized protein n=1 Tax=Oedothorax gibbosus TaxID=931172 RepID=A0AAV6VB07_9ARAC|nr:hypothetical protein JTE90_011500 [Oedothorax gibbosus]